MINPETQATLGIQNIGQRHKKVNKQTTKIKSKNENEKKRKINDPQHNTEPRMMNNIDTTKRLKVKPAE
jgi:hypothetical protein